MGTANAIPFTNDLNVSYFIGVDSQETYPQMFLTGDHNLGGNANPPTTAYLAAPSTGTPFVYLGTNFTVNEGPGFLDTMHSKQGNVGLADGSVQGFRPDRGCKTAFGVRVTWAVPSRSLRPGLLASLAA